MDFLTRLVPWLEPELAYFQEQMRSDRMPHAVLLEGPAGIGKLNLALNLANRLTQGPSDHRPLSPGQARTALQAYEAWSPEDPDLHLLRNEPGKSVIGVDAVRAIIDTLRLTGHGGRAKVAVICPAQLLNRAAANALLKTLEEPTTQTFLILVAHNRGMLPPTIISRCQIRTISPPSEASATRWLDGQRKAERLMLTDGAALRAVEKNDNFINFFNDIEEQLTLISKGQLDPVSAAGRWAKDEPGATLDGIAHLLQVLIRDRSKDSKSITDLTSARLHNAFGGRTLPTLFGWLDDVMAIRRTLGTGLNTELQIRSVLVAMAKR